MPGPPALAAEGLSFRYGRGPWLLYDLSLTVPPGGLLRVRGGNGSGKSTLLRLLAGSVAPRRGTVHRTGPVAYLPQQTGDLPAIDAPRLVRLIAGHRPDVDLPAARADELSRGWQRRVLLAAVLGLPCRILVLDEPTAGLDAAAVHRLAERVTARLAAGDAVVLAEHEPLPLPGGELLDLGGAVVPADVVEVLLGGTGSFRGHAASGGRLTLVVPAVERDALVLAALQAGWSVLSVGHRP